MIVTNNGNLEKSIVAVDVHQKIVEHITSIVVQHLPLTTEFDRSPRNCRPDVIELPVESTHGETFAGELYLTIATIEFCLYLHRHRLGYLRKIDKVFKLRQASILR